MDSNNLNSDVRQGLIFGVNSGVITTAGVVAGLVQANVNPTILVVTIISLAVSDSLAEAYGLFLSKKGEEPEDNSLGPVKSLVGVLIMKIGVMLSFLIPLLFSRKLKYYKNMSWPIIWGLLILTGLDYYTSKLRKEKILPYLVQHYVLLGIAILFNVFFSRIISKL